MRRAAMLAATLLAAGASILIGSPAFADQVTTSCTAGPPGGNWKLTGTANYSTSGGYEHWQSAGFKITAPITSGSNNVDIALRKSGPGGIETLWSYNSDSIASNVEYSQPINVTRPASELNYLKFRAIFDIPLMPDPSCKAYASLV